MTENPPPVSRRPPRGALALLYVSAVGIFALVLVSCSDVSFVDEITIVNQTEYGATVAVTNGERNGWLELAALSPDSTKTVEAVVDQGDSWIFRFDYIGQHEEEVETTRSDLEGSDWTIEVPPSFEERLHELGIPPPPP